MYSPPCGEFSSGNGTPREGERERDFNKYSKQENRDGKKNQRDKPVDGDDKRGKRRQRKRRTKRERERYNREEEDEKKNVNMLKISADDTSVPARA